MSFRTRLISFFLVIVVLPMIAMGALFYRLISDSEHGKADARAAGLATAAASLYQSSAAAARGDALALARDPAILSARGATLSRLATAAGLARVVISRGGRAVADVGDTTALAPGLARVRTSTRGAVALTLTVSSLTASEYVRDLSAREMGIVVRQGKRTLAQTIDASAQPSFPDRATLTIHGVHYQEVTQSLPGVTGLVRVTVLSDLSATAEKVTSSRLLAVAFIAGFIVLALAFAILTWQALHGQVTRFLHAARRLGAGDFSAPVSTDGRDEFAALAGEFNNMSAQLDERLMELTQERARLRELVRRIGQTFASNLDRPALLDLALKTAIDATQSDGGRVNVREKPGQPLTEAMRIGALAGLEQSVESAEEAALGEAQVGHGREDDVHLLSVAMRPVDPRRSAHGVITVARSGRSFGVEEEELLRSLAGQAALAIENIDLHLQVSRQAVTDELTGLANHGRFQEMLGAAAEQTRRYGHPLGLIMIDLDNFKSVNDTYGHQQGDVVLRRVGGVLQANSREADTAARYGGEELALILPHTDLEGAYAIAERIRVAVAALEIPRTGGGDPLSVTASIGVAASTAGDKDALIAEADAALYEAKRSGKNRVVQGVVGAPDVVGAE